MEISKILYNQIAAVCDTGTDIAIVKDNIYVLHDYLPSSSGNTSSIDFVSITGINVTEFFTMNSFDPTINVVQYNARFLKYIESLPILRMKFNKYTDYYIFSK